MIDVRESVKANKQNSYYKINKYEKTSPNVDSDCFGSPDIL